MIQKRLKELRQSKALTQATLAELIGVSQQTIWKWESGINEPDIPTILKIAELFEVTTDYLLGAEMRAEKDVSGNPLPKPTTVAAHISESVRMTPEVEARIQEIVEEAMRKYGRRDSDVTNMP